MRIHIRATCSGYVTDGCASLIAAWPGEWIGRPFNELANLLYGVSSNDIDQGIRSLHVTGQRE